MKKHVKISLINIFTYKMQKNPIEKIKKTIAISFFYFLVIEYFTKQDFINIKSQEANILLIEYLFQAIKI